MGNPIDGNKGKLGRGFMSADKLGEIDIGEGDKPRPTYISAGLEQEFRANLINLLKEFRDCFAWDYSEMPGLNRDLVEHGLPIKAGFRPYKQPARHFNPAIYNRIKKEINRLLEAGFIWSCR